MFKGQTGAWISGQLIRLHLKRNLFFIMCVDLNYHTICKLVWMWQIFTVHSYVCWDWSTSRFFTTVTHAMASFFETSKLWTIIILPLVGLECRRARIEPSQAIGTIWVLPSPCRTRLEPPLLYIKKKPRHRATVSHLWTQHCTHCLGHGLVISAVGAVHAAPRTLCRADWVDKVENKVSSDPMTSAYCIVLARCVA